MEESRTSPFQRASLLAARAQHSGDWLLALLISACGLRLGDEAVRIAVALRLGSECESLQPGVKNNNNNQQICIAPLRCNFRGAGVKPCVSLVNRGKSESHYHYQPSICFAIQSRLSTHTYVAPNTSEIQTTKLPTRTYWTTVYLFLTFYLSIYLSIFSR